MRRFLFLLMVLPACDGVEEATCEGGGVPALEVGTGTDSSFAPFEAGPTFEASGSAIALSLRTTGLDITMPVTTVVRISADGNPTADSISSLTYSCEGDGTGFAQVMAPLPDDAMDGSALEVTISMTDHVQTNLTADVVGSLSQ